jgi:hypothetical protein
MISTTLRRKLAIAGTALAGMLVLTAQPALAWESWAIARWATLPMPM